MAAKHNANLSEQEIALQKKRRKVGRVVLKGEGAISAKPLTMVPPLTDPPAADVDVGEKKDCQAPRVEILEPPPSSSSSKRKNVSEWEFFWADNVSDFAGEGEVCSLWDKRFPIRKVVKESLLASKDYGRVEELWLEQACLALQSLTLKATVIGQVIGEEFNKVYLTERQNRRELELTGKSLTTTTTNLQNEVKELKERLASQEKAADEKKEFLEKQLTELETKWQGKIAALKEQLREHFNSAAQLQSAVKKKDLEIEELEIEPASSLLKGFAQAEEQVRFLYPSLDLSQISVSKEILDGELVEVSDSSELEEGLSANDGSVQAMSTDE